MPQSSQEVVWTWNMIPTVLLLVVVLPAASALIVSSIKRHIDLKDKDRDEKDKRIEQLLEERECMKEEAISEWRGRFNETLCAVKVKVDEIAEGMHTKVPWPECDKREAEMKRRIESLERRA